MADFERGLTGKALLGTCGVAPAANLKPLLSFNATKSVQNATCASQIREIGHLERTPQRVGSDSSLTPYHLFGDALNWRALLCFRRGFGHARRLFGFRRFLLLLGFFAL